MSTLHLILVAGDASSEELHGVLSRSAGRAVLVVSEHFVQCVENACLCNACTYVCLKHLQLGLVCAYLLPFEFVEVTHATGHGGCDAMRLSDVESLRLCDDGFVLVSKGYDVDLKSNVHDVLPRRARGRFSYCADVASGNNTVLLRRDWLLPVLRRIRGDSSILRSIHALADRTLVALEVTEHGAAGSHDFCVCIFAYNRPHYFLQLVQSIHSQLGKEHVVLFLDGPGPRTSEEQSRQIIKNIDVVRKWIPHAKVCRAKQNLCVAQNQWWGLHTVFVRAAYQRALLLEDDVVLGNMALRSVRNMLPLLDLMKGVIAFNLGYRNYDERLFLRVVDPYPSEADIKDGCRQIDDHLHYWAWATTREKFMRMKKDYDYFYNAFFKGVQYSQRKVHAVMAAVRKRGVFTQHGSQDWTRHNCYKMNGMHYHIVPSRRLVVPIGVEGFHCNEQIFKKRLGLDDTRTDVYNKEVKVTTPFHHVHSIGIHPSLMRTHAWLMRLGYTRWSDLDGAPIIFVPSNASCDHPNAVTIGESDTENSRPWVRYVNCCVRELRIKSADLR